MHALDLPGFAGVPRFRGTVSIERYADAVERVIDDLGLEDPVLIGHSMGTQVVTEVAARRPELSDLVLISPVVDSSARTVRQSAFRFLRSTLHEPAAVRWHGITAYALCGWHWFRKVLPRMIAFPIEERAAHVQARTLIVRGEHDAMVPRDWVRRLARVFPARGPARGRRRCALGHARPGRRGRAARGGARRPPDPGPGRVLAAAGA
ncbi:alpha/beta fold hydrolase [Curtobacterium flaccumfaciens]|nr:alpha/beta fold hydrolase [Curtobacterium flaccumfaciens]